MLFDGSGNVAVKETQSNHLSLARSLNSGKPADWSASYGGGGVSSKAQRLLGTDASSPPNPVQFKFQRLLAQPNAQRLLEKDASSSPSSAQSKTQRLPGADAGSSPNPVQSKAEKLLGMKTRPSQGSSKAERLVGMGPSEGEGKVRKDLGLTLRSVNLSGF
ncbi:hypothetical protein EJ02DRAFT_461802 [Clathrospora elynae]|uniref:Uncharacterized protein n=1 Tax=Clathrospora elynae TaxID=706981 RepID=A0A6A5T8Y6_9PLEO|nr:hypothetical protein EJ02DRAFT_461802 [Clathrospora elynae]